MNANELTPEENTNLSAMRERREPVELNKLEEQVEPEQEEENEKNIVEPAQEKELDFINKEEVVARANLLRQREREQHGKKIEELTTSTKEDQIEAENLSEKNRVQDEKNTSEQIDGTTEKERQQSTERENIRKIDLMKRVHNQFLVVGTQFHFKDHPSKLAFKDKGERMVSASSDDRVAKAMAMMAEAKGWETIKVSGHPDFQREVWLEANMRGIVVRGFKPTEQDLKLLESKREYTMRNAVEHDQMVRERNPISQHSKHESEKNQGDENELLNQADVNKSAIRTYTGRVLEHGAANFNFDLQEKPNYFARLATDKGEKIIWGLDLERAMSEREIKTGDDITLAFMGSKAVTVEALKRNKEGKVIGTEKITTNRNVWDAQKSDKAKVTEAVASALINSKVKSPAQREALKEAVGSRILEREKVNKVPTISVYDKAAPTKSQQHDRTKPVVERKPERTR